MKDIVNERRQSGNRTDDLLDMLMHSVYEDTGEKMTEDKIADELIVLVFAGHETTSNTLSWMLYLLSQNSEVYKNLANDMSQITPLESLHNVHVQAVINESMRLYPAAWMTERMSLSDDSFEDYSYPAGTIIIPFFYGLHRDENLWLEGNLFKPDRFIEDDKIKRFKHFLPFGSGPRMCVGNNFAMAEMTFFLHAFVNKYLINKTSNVPNMIPLITLRPDKVVLTIKLRVN